MAEGSVDPEEREPYDVLDNFEYYAAMGATVWLYFEDEPDRSFQLGTQVGPDQVEKRESDGTIRVSLDGPRVSFYHHENTDRYSIAWNEPVEGVMNPVRTRVTLGVTPDA